MDELFQLAVEVEEYQRLEAERQDVMKQKLLLELELAKHLAGEHPVA